MLHLVAVKPDGLNSSPWVVGAVLLVIIVVGIGIFLRRRR